MGDSLVWARAFVEACAETPRPLGRRFLTALLRHDWPGNVRELRAVVEQAVARTPSDERIEAPWFAPAETAASGDSRTGRPTLGELRQELARCGGSMQALSKSLGIGRSTLSRWLDELGVGPDELRSS